MSCEISFNAGNAAEHRAVSAIERNPVRSSGLAMKSNPRRCRNLSAASVCRIRRTVVRGILRRRATAEDERGSSDAANSRMTWQARARLGIRYSLVVTPGRPRLAGLGWSARRRLVALPSAVTSGTPGLSGKTHNGADFRFVSMLLTSALGRRKRMGRTRTDPGDQHQCPSSSAAVDSSVAWLGAPTGEIRVPM